MSEKLKTIFRIDEESGIRCAVVGALIAFPGVGLAFWKFPNIGYWSAAFGGVLVFVGMVLHFVINWRTIFLGGG